MREFPGSPTLGLCTLTPVAQIKSLVTHGIMILQAMRHAPPQKKKNEKKKLN